MEEESQKMGKQKQMKPAEEEMRRVGKRRQTESAEEELEWWARVEKRLEQIKGLLEGLGPQITAFPVALSLQVGKIPDKNPYANDGKEGEEKEGEEDHMEE